MLRNVIIRQVVGIILISVVLGLLRNFLFSGGIELIADPAAFRTGSSAPIVTLDRAQLMFEDGITVFIDCRDKADYEESHIQGAANLDVRRFERLYNKLGRFVNGSTPLIVYAERNAPQKTGAIANKLSDAGHKNVYIAVIGFEGLSSSLPVETGGDPWVKGR